ncbi:MULTISPECIES: hypothetical protein [Bacillus cereus group]|uniref:Uncharacterized protein n=1 Tax=Bacillus mycoides TaxID=1405 RepID=A0A1G4ER32_BACMY|nr:MULTISPECIES: hypothetical protein [Bacillus cereus group]MCQ6358841.1 hypothetical protein [Bacillus cereus]SCB69141.1 Uncharacterized protein BWGO95_03293 [Bacillus mycoides]
MINSGEWEEAVDKHPFLQEYYNIERSTLIPFCTEAIQNRLDEEGSWSKKGGLYLETDPCDWETDSEYYTDLKGLEWTFITCLKEYEDKTQFNKTPIQSFIDIVLSEVITKSIKVQLYYHDLNKPIEYIFDGKKIAKLINN